MMEIALWLCLSAGAVLWASSWWLCARFRRVPDVGDSSSEPDRAPFISVVIPARDEERNLGCLLPSLQRQSREAREILVVDDHSSDGTAQVSSSAGARVIEAESLPPGWLGKPWACQQGAQAARGEWLLFLDADVELAPSAMARLEALALEGAAVHSVCPWHRIEKTYEEFSAFFNVIMLLGTNAFSAKGKHTAEIGLFGQILFLPRELYLKHGGHEEVKGEVLENFHLSRLYGRSGISRRCYLGRGFATMRMYPESLRQLAAGWKKGFAAGAANTPRIALLGISLWLSGLILATVSLLWLPLVGDGARLAIVGLYLLAAFQCAWLFRRAGGFSSLNALCFPISLGFYQWLFFQAVGARRRGERVSWKGREV